MNLLKSFIDEFYISFFVIDILYNIYSKKKEEKRKEKKETRGNKEERRNKERKRNKLYHTFLIAKRDIRVSQEFKFIAKYNVHF